eukprot:TRINITY_DN1234_c0_g1_i1.p1 TRINITY_DN1234_c0_g1~~TRINITY_DN1234_c0_g1_i1.p1  ORF type:complete len:324 (+),score=53.74 TRINITY_DN1234_c0_g1_i1:65-973(+)
MQLGSLDDAVLVRVLSFAGPRAVLAASLTCRRLRAVCTLDAAWCSVLRGSARLRARSAWWPAMPYRQKRQQQRGLRPHALLMDAKTDAWLDTCAGDVAVAAIGPQYCGISTLAGCLQSLASELMHKGDPAVCIDAGHFARPLCSVHYLPLSQGVASRVPSCALAVLCCFSVASLVSYESLATQVSCALLDRTISKRVPRFLVGLQSDRPSGLPKDELLEYATVLRARYFECSCLRQTGLRDLLIEVLHRGAAFGIAAVSVPTTPSTRAAHSPSATVPRITVSGDVCGDAVINRERLGKLARR